MAQQGIERSSEDLQYGLVALDAVHGVGRVGWTRKRLRIRHVAFTQVCLKGCVRRATHRMPNVLRLGHACDWNDRIIQLSRSCERLWQRHFIALRYCHQYMWHPSSFFHLKGLRTHICPARRKHLLKFDT